jgi:hypothetical protein
MISGFRGGVRETGALLGSYAASSGNLLLKIWNNMSVFSSRVKNLLSLEDGNDRLSQNVAA